MNLNLPDNKCEQQERWLPVIIPDFPIFSELYEISDFGRFRRRVSGMNSKAGQILGLGKTRTGYYLIAMTKKPIRKWFLVHRAVAFAFLPNPDGKPHINHKDGNKANNRLENLEWVTSSENAIHKHNVLKHPPACGIGEKCRFAKLTEQDVREIRAWWKTGDVTQKALGARWGVIQQTISLLVRNINWASIT